MKIAVFWAVAPCSLVEVYQRFRGPCCLHHQGDRYNPEDSNLRFKHCFFSSLANFLFLMKLTVEKTA
jgi:hypothetical protein